VAPDAPTHSLIAQVCRAKGLVEQSHHGRPDFRWQGKIVVNLEDDGWITVKLPIVEQQSLLAEHAGLVRLPNGWGHLGWTTLDVVQLEPGIIDELIDLAIATVAAPKPRKKPGK
jgi:hypothetical protein